MRPVALLTDFGLADPYAGQMRAALARLAPGAAVLDITHQVEPFAVDQAAFFLAASAPHYPPDAVFLCVVDPGVGSPRRIIGLHVPEPNGCEGGVPRGQDFLAPDNGLLGLVLTTPGLARARLYDLSAAAGQYAASATFHGRDVFAPLAARLSAGEILAGMGRELSFDDIELPCWAEPGAGCEGADGAETRVLHVDRYGNCLLSLRATEARNGQAATLHMSWGQRRPVIPVRTYADLPSGAVGILAGSQGFLELAMNQGSAAASLGLRRGDALRVRWGLGA